MSGETENEKITLNDLVRSHVLPILVQCLRAEDRTSLQFIVASAITDFVSGTSAQGNKAISVGVVPLFVRLLASSAFQEYERVVWELNNIVCYTPALLDYFVDGGFVGQIVSLIKPDAPVSLLRNVAHVISRLCCDEYSEPPYDVMCEIFEAVDELLNFTDPFILIKTVRGINNLEHEKAQCGFTPKLIALLGHSEVLVNQAALQGIGQAIEESQERARYIRDALPYFPALLSHWNEEVREKALQFLNAIVAKGDAQSAIHAIIRNGLVPKIIENFGHSEIKIKRAAIWTIVYVVIESDRDHFPILIKEGVMPPLCEVLDSALLWGVLKGLIYMFEAADADTQQVANLIKECGGLEKIKILRSHELRCIPELAEEIITKYFPAEA